MVNTSKKCPSCGIEKPLDGGFYKLAPKPSSGHKGGYSSHCRECQLKAKRKPRVCHGCGKTYFQIGSSGSRRRICDACAEVGRVCPRCNEFKPLDRFYSSQKRGGGCYCRDGCALAVNRESKYGILRSEHDALDAAKSAGCPICGATDRRMALDHDHSTGAFRGIICSQCNSGLGMFGDSVEAILAAAAYLKKHSASRI